MTYPVPHDSSPTKPAAAEFHEDAILGGRYRIISLLGRGGMGVVYKVEQIFLGKELALKTIVKSEQTDFVLRRFQTEARAVFSLHHPNIIAVHDFGFLDDNMPFMAMEVIHGQTLGDLLKKRTLSVDEAIPLFVQICFGLAHAHDCGIVHRDIKPNNIMILDGLPWGTEGSIKILDFGIAKLAQHEGGEIQALTRTGEIFGSPFYMSPEQCLGTKVDHRSDIYSLGCVLFECLTGRPPFSGDNAMNTMMMHQRSVCPRLKDAAPEKQFPPELEQILQTMLAKNPDDRYQNLGFTAHDLADLKRSEKSNISAVVQIARPARPPVDAPDLVKVEKSKFITTMVMTALLCSLCTGSVMHYLHSRQEETVQPTTSEGKNSFSGPGFPNLNNPNAALRLAEKTLRPADENTTKDDIKLATPGDLSEDSIQQGISAHESKFDVGDAPTDKTLEAFKKYNNAQFVMLPNCNITDAGLKNLQDSKLLVLGLSGDKEIKSVDEISKQRHLQRLNLSDTGITDAALPKLADLPMLDQLDLTGCNITEKGLMALTKSTSLTLIQVSVDRFPKPFIATLQDKMPQCVFKGYFDNSNINDALDKQRGRSSSERLQTTYQMASKANPLSRVAAEVLIGIATEKVKENPAKTDRNQEIWKLLKHSENISATRNDEQMLAAALLAEARYKALYGKPNEAFELQKRAVKLDFDNNMHDDRSLIERIFSAACYADQLNKHDAAIEYDKLALKLIDESPTKNRDYLPVLCEMIFWQSYITGQGAKNAEYAQRNFEYWQIHKNDETPVDEGNAYRENPRLYYARSLVEMGHALSDENERKKYYQEALTLLDSLHYPEQINLCEHYCDASVRLSEFCQAAGDRAKAVAYLEKAQVVLRQMKHPDYVNRKKFFADRIASIKQSK